MMDSSCLTCEFTNELYVTMQIFGINIFKYLAPISATFIAVLSILFIGIQVIQMVVTKDFGKRLHAAGSFVLSVAAIIPFLDVFSEIPLVYSWIIMPVEQLAAGLAVGIVEIASGDGLQAVGDLALGQGPSGLQEAVTVTVFDRQQVNQYAVLALAIEKSIAYAMYLAWALVGDSIAGSIAGILLLIPFTLSMIIFLAFLVEVMFAFLVVGGLSPLFALSFPFSAMRSLTKSAGQVLLHSFFTIILSAVVLGFGVTAVEQLGRKINTLEALQETFQPQFNSLNAQYLKVCPEKLYVPGMQGLKIRENPDHDAVACIEVQTKLARLNADFKDASPIEPGNSAYFLLLMMGGVLVLLLLRVKSLASALSGVQDSAGAAATVGAGIQAIGAGALVAMKGGSLGAINEAMKLSLAGAGFGRKSPADLATKPSG